RNSKKRTNDQTYQNSNVANKTGKEQVNKQDQDKNDKSHQDELDRAITWRGWISSLRPADCNRQQRNTNNRNDRSSNDRWKEANEAAKKRTDQQRYQTSNNNRTVNSSQAIVRTDQNHGSNCGKGAAL